MLYANPFPKKLAFLFTPARYKVAYGGRGAAKSWGMARALLTLGVEKKLRILCAREIQNSIKDSVHKLFVDQIPALGFSGHYEVQRDVIIGINGTEIIFEGLRHNINTIRSKEGIDIAWVEEAQTVSKTSWEALIPTIRKPGSEIWVSFNPELDTDETYKRFVLNPPEGAIVKRINWQDNPWFPEVLRSEKDSLRDRDYDAYLTVWEGNCRHTLDGAIFADEMRKVVSDGRITKVPYDPSRPVHTFWDLGWSDLTSIWFVQQVGFQYHFIDYHQDRHKSVEHYLKILQNKNYVYGFDYLPHDAESGGLASSGRGVDHLMRAAGRKIRIVSRVSKKMMGINAARTVFDNCWFDEEKCSDGLQCLRRYRYKVDSEGVLSREPLHDENSHGADAFMQFGLSMKPEHKINEEPKRKPAVSRNYSGSASWMH